MIGSVVDKVMRASPIAVLGVPEKGGGRIGKVAKSDEGEEADAAEIAPEQMIREAPDDAPAE